MEKTKPNATTGPNRYARLSDLPREEWPRERANRVGLEGLGTAELLALLIRSGGGGRDVLEVAGSLLDRAGSLPAMMGWKRADFEAIPGIGPIKALELGAALQLARRVLRENHGERPVLDEPALVFDYLRPSAVGLDTERFWVLGLNRKNQLIRQEQVSEGTATGSLAHPREIFREAIRQGAAALVVAHNHPSGDPSPSRADIEVTRRLREASRVIGIDLLDHVIVGHPSSDPRALGYYSFSEAGLL